MFAKKLFRILLLEMMNLSAFRGSLRYLAQKGVLPVSLWKRLPVESIFDVESYDDTYFKYSSIGNDGIGRALFWRGLRAWEAETTSTFFRLAKKANLVIDIGANTGVFSLLACLANPRATVISFEPVPRIYNKLQENIRLNGWGDRCQLRCEAVSDVTGSTQFHVPLSDLPTSASLHEHGFRGIKGQLITVSVETVDNLLSKELKVDLVKIDVEGFEDKVLMGMRRVLRDSAPKIIFECNPDGPFAVIKTILEDSGYQIFHLTNQGAIPFDRDNIDENEEFRNFLATTETDLKL